jgi:hypothetical protein
LTILGISPRKHALQHAKFGWKPRHSAPKLAITRQAHYGAVTFARTIRKCIQRHTEPLRKKEQVTMKFFSKFAVTSAVIALAFVSTANAQSMRVDVPFGFKAGGLSLPAGSYQVAVNREAQRISLSKLDGKVNCFLTVKSFDYSAAPQHGSLVFNQYGNSYFLSKVKSAGSGGADLSISRAEREFAKAQPDLKPTMVLASGR